MTDRPDTAESPAARPTTPEGVTVRASPKTIRSWAKTGGSILLLALTSAGGGYSGHHMADGQSEAQLQALQKAFDQHLAQSAADKEQLEAQARDTHKELEAARLEYSTQLAGVHQSLIDLDKTLGRIEDQLTAQRGAVLSRYQPRRPSVDHRRVEPADDPQ